MSQDEIKSTVRLDKLISSMDKAFRSYRLYEARGPQYEAHVREMASQAALSTEQGPAVLTVTPYGLQAGLKPSASDSELNRTWFELFEQGARQVVFTGGIETKEVRELLHIMAGDQYGDDILTVLWRRNLPHIQIAVSRTLVRGRRSHVDSSEAIQAQYGHWRNLLVPDAKASQHRVEIQPDDLRVLAVNSKPLLWCADCQEPRTEQESVRAGLFDGDVEDMDAFLGLLSPLESSEIDRVLTSLIGSYARLGLTEKINALMSAAETHPALSGWSMERMLTAAGGLQAFVPLLESGPAVFRESLSAMAAFNVDLIEELMEHIETDSVRQEVESILVTPASAPLAFHSARLSGSVVEEQLESVRALFDMDTQEAIYLAIEGCGSAYVEVRKYTLSRMEPLYEPSMRNSLTRLYRDRNESVRIEVYRFIKRTGNRYFLREALATAKDAYFSRKSEEEQWELIQALSAHGQLPPINLFFCGLAGSGSLWATEHRLRMQLESVRVLEQYPSMDGLHTLKKLSRRRVGSKEIREAAKAALERLWGQQSIEPEDPAGGGAS